MEPSALDTLVGAARWRTFRPERCVLVVVHNVTALTRLREVLPLLSGDPRVQLVYTCTGSSAFPSGTLESLADMRYVPWADAVRLRFDLAISASYGGDLHELNSPLLTVPHGMGYNILQSKTENRKPKTENRQAVFGLSREWLTHEGSVVPSLIVLSHDEQLARLRAACPEAVPAAVVAGDIVFDRLLASRPLRASYRDSLGVRPGQRLVVVSSTWGPRSLLGTRPDLARTLALHCPVDEYRIALAAHPNVWQGHSPWQVREWLAATERAGVAVLPTDGWKSALVAADVVVGDHGSVTYYGAALGKPVLLASAPDDVVAPDSPIARLLTVAPRLDTADPDNLAAAIDNHDPHRELAALTTSHPGRAAELLRRTIYGALDLTEPAEDAPVMAVPVLPRMSGDPRACLVAVTWSDDQASVVRYPAERLKDREPTPRAAHLAVGTDEPRRRWLELADVLINDRPATDPAHWISETLSALPGCLLAATRSTDGHWHVGTSDHTVVLTTTAGARGASAVHGWLTAGHPLADLPARFTIQPGDHEVAIITRHRQLGSGAPWI